jgi:hypothetical protein
MYTYWRIERTPLNDDGVWDTEDTVVLVDFRNPLIMMKTGDGKDNFTLRIENFNRKYSNVFQERDRLKIYHIKNNTTGFTDSDLIIDGTISNIKYDITGSNNSISIEGYNFTEALFGALVFVDSRDLTIDVALKTAVEQIGGLSKVYKLTWAETNPTTKSNGEPFPLVGERYYYKTFNKMIEDLSSQTKTEDGNYFWFVDNDNVVHWRKRTAEIVDSFNTLNDNFISLKTGKDTTGIKNFIIIKGGYDAKDKPIQTRYTNYTSIAKNGYKFYFLVDDTRLSENLEEFDASRLGVSRMKDYSWGTYKPPWSDITYNNFNDYNDALRVYVKEKLKEKGKIFASMYEFGEMTVDIELKAKERQWVLCNTISFILPELSNTPINLRVTEIQYETSIYKYTLEEDDV